MEKLGPTGKAIQVVVPYGQGLGTAASGADRSVTATSAVWTEILPANIDRMRGNIANDTAVDVYILASATQPVAGVAAAPGLGRYRVAANGGYFDDVWGDRWWVRSTGADAAITAREA